MKLPSRRERREQERAQDKAARRALPMFPDTPTRRAIRLRYAGALAGEADAVPSHREAFAAQGEVVRGWVEAIAAFDGGAASYELQQALHVLLGDPKGDLESAREK